MLFLDLLFSVLLYTYVLSAQTQVLPQSDTEQEVSEPEKPEGIAIIDISERAQETRITLNKISTNLAPDADNLEIKQQLPKFLFALRKKHSSWFNDSLKKLSTRKLNRYF